MPGSRAVRPASSRGVLRACNGDRDAGPKARDAFPRGARRAVAADSREIASPRLAAGGLHHLRTAGRSLRGVATLRLRDDAGSSPGPVAGLPSRDGCRRVRYNHSAVAVAGPSDAGEARRLDRPWRPLHERASGRDGRGRRSGRPQCSDAACGRKGGRCEVARSAPHFPWSAPKAVRRRGGRRQATRSRPPARMREQAREQPRRASGSAGTRRPAKARSPRQSAPRLGWEGSGRNSVGRLRRVEWETSPGGSMGTRAVRRRGAAGRAWALWGMATGGPMAPAARGRESGTPCPGRDWPKGWVSRPAPPSESCRSDLGSSVQVPLLTHGHAWTKATPPGEGDVQHRAGPARSVL